MVERKREITRRCTVPLLLFAILIFVVSDLALYSGDVLEQYRYIRLCAQVPAILIFFFITQFPRFYRRYHQLSNVCFTMVLGMSFIAMGIVGKDPSHGPQMLFYFVVYMFVELRFLQATGVAIVLYIMFIIATNTFEIDRTSKFSFATSIAYLTISNVTLMFAAYLTEYWNRVDHVRNRMQVDEQTRTEQLLRRLLPERITEKLVQSPNKSVLAEDHRRVTVLFTDLKGFTAFSSGLEPAQLAKYLNHLYREFDHILMVNSVWKIETIGDAYFCASGLNAEADHAVACAAASFSFLDALALFCATHNVKLQMRIGIHTGPVLAGLVGLKVPRYHLFGETVTVANTMESTGEPDHIHITDQTASEIHAHMEEQDAKEREEMERSGTRKPEEEDDVGEESQSRSQSRRYVTHKRYLNMMWEGKNYTTYLLYTSEQAEDICAANGGELPEFAKGGGSWPMLQKLESEAKEKEAKEKEAKEREMKDALGSPSAFNFHGGRAAIAQGGQARGGPMELKEFDLDIVPSLTAVPASSSSAASTALLSSSSSAPNSDGVKPKAGARTVTLAPSSSSSSPSSSVAPAAARTSAQLSAAPASSSDVGSGRRVVMLHMNPSSPSSSEGAETDLGAQTQAANEVSLAGTTTTTTMTMASSTVEGGSATAVSSPATPTKSPSSQPQAATSPSSASLGTVSRSPASAAVAVVHKSLPLGGARGGTPAKH